MSYELEALKALKEQGQLDTYDTAKASGDAEPDCSKWSTRLVTMEGLGLVVRDDEDYMLPTMWAITPAGLNFLEE